MAEASTIGSGTNFVIPLMVLNLATATLCKSVNHNILVYCSIRQLWRNKMSKITCITVEPHNIYVNSFKPLHSNKPRDMKPYFILLLTAAIFSGTSSGMPFMNMKAKSPGITGMAEPKVDTTTYKCISGSQFLITAYNTGIFEIRAGRLARRMTQDKNVRAYAVTMINDHEAMNKDVLAIMQKKGYAIPAKLPCDLKAKYKYLNQCMGKKFGRKYAAVDIDEHKLIVALFTETSVKGTDDEVR